MVTRISDVVLKIGNIVEGLSLRMWLEMEETSKWDSRTGYSCIAGLVLLGAAWWESRD